MQQTEILSPHTARVNGKTTGLAGCSESAACPHAGHCLRADERLARRAEPMRDLSHRECLVYISTQESAS